MLIRFPWLQGAIINQVEYNWKGQRSLLMHRMSLFTLNSFSGAANDIDLEFDPIKLLCGNNLCWLSIPKLYTSRLFSLRADCRLHIFSFKDSIEIKLTR
jgi:hypothetical protein